MPEWWAYGLSDFLLFSPRTYYRLYQRYNEAIWPAQVLVLALAVLVLTTLRYRRPRPAPALSGLFAALWAWVGLAFVWQRYATINWAAAYVVPFFGLEALLWLWLGVVRRRLKLRAGRDLRSRIGFALLFLAIAVYPALAAMLGRDWRAAEVFGLAPDPTAIGTLGLLLLSSRPHGLLMVVPLLWCLLSGMTLWALGSAEAWVVLLAGLLIVGTWVWSRAGHRGDVDPPLVSPKPGRYLPG